MRLILCLLFAGILAGCSTLTYVDIQTCNPAEITFPATVGKVLVVNHAVAQPADKGSICWATRSRIPVGPMLTVR